MFFELSWACEVEGGMAPEGIVEPIDVAANGQVGFVAGVEDSPPDELGFEGLEERLDHGVVVAIPLAGRFQPSSDRPCSAPWCRRAQLRSPLRCRTPPLPATGPINITSVCKDKCGQRADATPER